MDENKENKKGFKKTEDNEVSTNDLNETQETKAETEAEEVEKRKGGRPKKAGKSIDNPLIEEASFWYYVSLGEKRSLDKVAEHFDLDIWVVKELSRRNKWTDKVKDFSTSDSYIGSDIVKHIDSIRMAVLTAIIENPKSSSKDKMQALKELTDFIKQSSDLVQKKKIVIDFPHKEELQKIVDGLKDGSAYKDVLGKAGYSVPLPEEK
jgi:hypothetical protein